MTNHEGDILSFLIHKYAPEIVLVSGSRAAGTERSDSDWDLFLIGTYGAVRERVAEAFQGTHLDLELVPLRSLEDPVLRIYYGPVKALKVLLDNATGYGQVIVAATLLAYDCGPTPLTLQHIHQHANNLARLLSKVEVYVGEPIASAIHLGVFLHELLPCWFALRQEWSQPPQLAVPYIREHDPQLFTALTDMVNFGTAVQRASACRCAYERLFPNVISDHDAER